MPFPNIAGRKPFRMHESGWTAQLANIEKHVTGHSEAALGA
jgi:hypothetical protein